MRKENGGGKVRVKKWGREKEEEGVGSRRRKGIGSRRSKGVGKQEEEGVFFLGGGGREAGRELSLI